MSASFSLALSRIDWTVFCSLTFRKEPSEASAIVAAEKLLKWAAHIQRMRFKDMEFVIRIETGERTGRRHLHLLLRVDRRFMGYFVVQAGRSSIARKWWIKHYGIAQFRRIESGCDSAVAYITKDMDAGADIYELAKAARSTHLIISPTALRCIRRRIGSADSQTRATNTLAESDK